MKSYEGKQAGTGSGDWYLGIWHSALDSSPIKYREKVKQTPSVKWDWKCGERRVRENSLVTSRKQQKIVKQKEKMIKR